MCAFYGRKEWPKYKGTGHWNSAVLYACTSVVDRLTGWLLDCIISLSFSLFVSFFLSLPFMEPTRSLRITVTPWNNGNRYATISDARASVQGRHGQSAGLLHRIELWKTREMRSQEMAPVAGYRSLFLNKLSQFKYLKWKKCLDPERLESLAWFAKKNVSHYVCFMKIANDFLGINNIK